ncbi:MAG: IS200/IS605 family transposase [Chloroflexota bacterium]
MRSTHTELFVHLVWATWDRLPLISAAVEPRLYAAIAEKCHDMRCAPLAIGGVADHIHVLVRLHPTIPVATLAKELKGSSSHLLTHEVAPDAFFKWQGAYSACTLRTENVPAVQRYIACQKEHHRQGDVQNEWEAQDGDQAGD